MVKESLPFVKGSRTGQTFELLWREEWVGGVEETRHEVVGQAGRGDGQEGGGGEVQARKPNVCWDFVEMERLRFEIRGCIEN